MTQENLICIGSALTFGLIAGGVGILVIQRITERLRRRRLSHMPRASVLFRP